MTTNRILYWAGRVQRSVESSDVFYDSLLASWQSPQSWWKMLDPDDATGSMPGGVELCDCMCHAPIGSRDVRDMSTQCIHCMILGG